MSGDSDSGLFPADLVAIAQRFVHGLSPKLRSVHERRFLAAESQERAAESLGATVVDDKALSLDEIFVSHVATEPNVATRS